MLIKDPDATSIILDETETDNRLEICTVKLQVLAHLVLKHMIQTRQFSRSAKYFKQVQIITAFPYH